MTCRNCNSANQTADFCTECGKPVQSVGQVTAPMSQYPLPTPSAAPANSGLAIAGFVLSLVGLLVLPLILGIVGVTLSAVGLKAGKRRLANFGLAIGIFDIVYGIVTLVMNLN
jgi:hypothetical protein